ncbi:MAG: beta-ketoacyl-[acyl-carrier-protein] synthase family protein, partial [Planctomycetota bacterium]
LGTGGGGIDFTGKQIRAMAEGRRPSLWTVTNATHGNLAGELSIRLGLRGPSLCVSTGCASSSDAVGMAMDLLRSRRPGSPEAMVVVGADAHITAEVLHSMELLGVISKRANETEAEAAAASRPFDADRDGFVLGEGAWAVVLASAEFCERVGARAPIAEMLGYGSTCDAYHRVRPDPEMTQSVRAMRLAIEDAGLEADDIEHVHYHGTGTKLNDEQETVAVRRALGDQAERTAGTSVKSMIGHPQGASGLASLVASIGSLAGLDGGEPFVPPTANLDRPDPACDLDYTANAARLTGARTMLVNCLAFGAKNSALVARVCR